MKKNIAIISLIFLVPLFAYFFLTMSSQSTAKTVQGRPQVLKYTSEMCLDCQTMNKVFKEIFPKYKDRITLTEIKVQEKNSYNDSMIKQHNVTLVPTIILLNSNGKVIKRIEGAIPSEEMDKCLKELE